MIKYLRPSESIVQALLGREEGKKASPAEAHLIDFPTLATIQPIIYLILQPTHGAEKVFSSVPVNGVKFSREIGSAIGRWKRRGDNRAPTPGVSSLFFCDRVKNATDIKQRRPMVRER